MKYCPKCNCSYEDNNYIYCLDDGTALLTHSEMMEADTFTLELPRANFPTEPLKQSPNDRVNLVTSPEIKENPPDLIDQFLETLDFQTKRRQLKESRIGVNAFEFEVKLLIHKLEEMVDEANKRPKMQDSVWKHFEFKGDAQGCSIFSRETGIQLVVAWDNESLIDLAEAKLFIGLRDHRGLSTDADLGEPKEFYKLEFRPDVKPNFQKGWKRPENKDHFLTSEELAKEFFSSFVQRALKVVKGEI